jgi:integrase
MQLMNLVWIPRRGQGVVFDGSGVAVGTIHVPRGHHTARVYLRTRDAIVTQCRDERFRPARREKAGLSTTSLHSTRHSTATTLVRARVDLRTVASIMGHSNASVTLGI